MDGPGEPTKRVRLSNEDITPSPSLPAAEEEHSSPKNNSPRGRLSLKSWDMFDDSPPSAHKAGTPPPADDGILTPLFELSTNAGELQPKTVRLQILSIVGIDRLGYIGVTIHSKSPLITHIYFPDLKMSDGQHWAHFKTPAHTKKYFL